MKKIISILLIALLVLIAVPVFANTTFVVPTGVYGVYDRDGNAYAISASRTINVPSRYFHDFVNAGYVPYGIQAVLCGTTGTCANTNAVPKIYVGKVTLLVQSPNTAAIAGFNFADTNYICTATDTTRGLPVWIAPGNVTTVQLMGQAGSTVNYMCVGQ
jgi:hypothetical protein